MQKKKKKVAISKTKCHKALRIENRDVWEGILHFHLIYTTFVLEPIELTGNEDSAYLAWDMWDL